MDGRPPRLSRLTGGTENASNNVSLPDSSSGFTILMRQFQGEDDEPLSPLKPTFCPSSVCRPIKPLSFRFLELQNLPYPHSLTDYRIQCSNGFVRVHGLLLYSVSQYFKENYGMQVSDGEEILQFPDCDVLDMAKIVFIFYTGSTMFAIDRRPALVKIIKRFRCPEDRMVLSVPLKHSKTFEQIYLRELDDMRVQVGNTNLGGVEESYFVAANGDIQGQETPSFNHMPNLSMQQATGTRSSAAYVVPQNLARPQKVICGGCPEGKLIGLEDFDIHVQFAHGGDWNTESTTRVLWNEQQLAQHSDDMTRPLYPGITPMVERMSNRMPRMTSHTHDTVPNNYTKLKRPSTSGQANPPEGKRQKRDLSPQPSTSAAGMRNQMTRREIGPTYYWYCPFCHWRSFLKELMIRHLSELHPGWNQEGATDHGPVYCPTNDRGASEKYECLICPDTEGENSFRSVSLAGLELHSRKIHEVIRLTHYVLQPRPKCRVCGKHHRTFLEKANTFFKHVYSCLQNKLKKKGHWNCVPQPSPDPLPRGANERFWYNKLCLETSSLDFNSAYLGKLDNAPRNFPEPELILSDGLRSPPPGVAARDVNPETEAVIPQIQERRSKRKIQPPAKILDKENVPSLQQKRQHHFPRQKLISSSPIERPRRGRPTSKKPKDKTKSKPEKNRPSPKNVAVVMAETPTESPRNGLDQTDMSRCSLPDQNQIRVQNQDLETEEIKEPLRKLIVRVSNSNNLEDGQEDGSNGWIVLDKSRVPETPEVVMPLESRRSEDAGSTMDGPPLTTEGMVNPTTEESDFASASDVWFDDIEEPGSGGVLVPPVVLEHSESTNPNDGKNSLELSNADGVPQDREPIDVAGEISKTS